ncbi:MAG: membrane protein insertion efficiency factor YidD [bacterium]|nr:membrane protein insertion efficiency factor YidD [bacterium]
MNTIIRYGIVLYQKTISPDKNIFIRRAPSCRFYPSCSEYGLMAFGRYGFLKALYYTGKRIFKCHPFSQGGYDPLP